MTQYFDIFNIPLGKNEDFIAKGRIQKNNQDQTNQDQDFDYIIVCDGHGDVYKNFMQDIRQLNMDALVSTECPATTLYHLMNDSNKYHIQAGCTFACAKIYHDRVDTFTIGDSNIFVYINKQLAYVSPDHNIHNESEVERLAAAEITYVVKDDQTFKLISPTVVIPHKAQSMHFVEPIPYIEPYSNCDLYVAMSQTIGHHGITGLAPARQTIYFNKAVDCVDIFVASDGVWDIFDPETIEHDMHFILNEKKIIKQESSLESELELDLDLKNIFVTAEIIAYEAEKRWKQGWDYEYNGKVYPDTEFGSKGWDDVSVGIWRHRPVAYAYDLDTLTPTFTLAETDLTQQVAEEIVDYTDNPLFTK